MISKNQNLDKLNKMTEMSLYIIWAYILGHLFGIYKQI